MKRAHPFVAAARRELSLWPGVEMQRQQRGKHPALVFTYGGASKFVTYSGSPSDAYGGERQFLRDVRGVLADLGAQRTETPKAPARRRQTTRHAPQPERLRACAEPLRCDPSRDPWVRLADLRFPDPRPLAAFWRRLWAAVQAQRARPA